MFLIMDVILFFINLLLIHTQNVVLLVHFFTGLILMVISFIMGLIKTTASANSFLKVGFLHPYAFFTRRSYNFYYYFVL